MVKDGFLTLSVLDVMRFEVFKQSFGRPNQIPILQLGLEISFLIILIKKLFKESSTK